MVPHREQTAALSPNYEINTTMEIIWVFQKRNTKTTALLRSGWPEALGICELMQKGTINPPG